MLYAYPYTSPFGEIYLFGDGDTLTTVKFAPIREKLAADDQSANLQPTQDSTWFKPDRQQEIASLLGHTNFRYKEEPFSEVISELNRYFKGDLKKFTVSIDLTNPGTPFQRSVWEALCEIPYGTTVTYTDLAKAIGNPKAQRAVGLANNRNPLAIIVPCHRVIGANGALVGYAGGLPFKKALLHLEEADENLNLTDKSTKDIILQVAVEEFATHGPNGARVDRIATKSGINKRMLYEYFENKMGLLTYIKEHLDSLPVSDGQRSQIQLWDMASEQGDQPSVREEIAAIEKRIKSSQVQGDINSKVQPENLARLVYLVERYGSTLANEDSSDPKAALLAMLKSLVSVPRQVEPVVKRLKS